MRIQQVRTEIYGTYIVERERVKPDDSKIKAVQEFQRPTTPAEVRNFLGLVNFCAKYIPNFATIPELLKKLTRKEIKWNWCSEQQDAFERLKKIEVMSYYNQNEETNIIVDASPY